MNWIQNFVKKLFRIDTRQDREVVIIEPHAV